MIPQREGRLEVALERFEPPEPSEPFVIRQPGKAHARGVTEESLLLTRRNCTGQPANAFNKPKVDLGPAALAFAPPAECAANGGATEDGAERTLAAALALYPALRRTLK